MCLTIRAFPHAARRIAANIAKLPELVNGAKLVRADSREAT
jgi:hypothetical protein